MSENNDKSLIVHLEELRNTLISCFISVIVLFPFAFYFSPKLLDKFIKIIIGNNKLTLNFFSPMEVFIVQIKLALLISAVVAFPYIVKKLWSYIVPALYENERKFVGRLVFASTCLFLTGCLFCLFMILPLIINFGMSFSNSNITALFGVSNIVNLSLGLIFVFGLMFQIPLVVHFLIKWEIISKGSVSHLRPYVVIILLIICAILTPPDVISQLLLFIPTYALFELGLLFSKEKKKEDY